MTYQGTQDYIENVCTSGSVYDIDCIKQLLKILRSPEKSFGVIHVAGTNGKGSVSRMLMHILKCAGYTVGIFNSPFLEKRNEYLCVNGTNASDDEYSLIAGIVKNAIEREISGGKSLKRRPTEFEFSFAMAMEYFSRKGCDLAIVECGLGGLTDATNVFKETVLDVITNIGLDHVKLLGNTLKDIAYQKCGIICKNGRVVAYPSEDEALAVIRNECKRNGASLQVAVYKDIKKSLGDAELSEIALKGEFQKRNAATAICCMEVLRSQGFRISDDDVKNGLKSVVWPGRFEFLRTNPLVIADGGHNPQCISALSESLCEYGIKKAVFVIGIMADKDYRTTFDMLKPFASYVIGTEPENARRLDAEIIAGYFGSYVPAEVCREPAAAVKRALEIVNKGNLKDYPIVITGSLYMMKDIRSVFMSV